MTDGIRDALGMDSKNRKNRDGEIETVVKASDLRALLKQLHQEREKRERNKEAADAWMNTARRLQRELEKCRKQREQARAQRNQYRKERDKARADLDALEEQFLGPE
jgi:uncharacterized protein (DUF3084 family)